MTLTPERRELLARMLAERGLAQAPETHQIPRRRDAGSAPLTFAQEALWFVDQLDPDGASHNVPTAVRLRGALDVLVLEHSLDEIVRRHDALRTTFPTRQGQPRQSVARHVSLALDVVDLSSHESVESELLLRATEEAHRPFDLEKGPLFRAFLLRLGHDDHALLLNFHHLVTDGWSMGVFTRELNALYAAYLRGAASPLPELPIQLGDVAAWQRERRDPDGMEEDLAYWRGVVGGGLPSFEIPLDHPRPEVRSFRGRHHPVHLPPLLSDALRVLARRHGVTPFMTLLAVFDAVLHFETGCDDIVVGSAAAHRNRSELEPLIGFLVDMLVLRTDLSGDPSLSELMERVRDTTLGAQAHQGLPLTRLVKEIQPGRDLGRSPLFQVEFSLLTPDVNPAVYGYGLGSGVIEEIEVAGLVATPVPVQYDNARYDLAFFLWDLPDGIRGTVEYSAELFEPGSISRLVEHFERSLEFAVARPQGRISELAEHLRRSERQRRSAAGEQFESAALRMLRSRRRIGRGRHREEGPT